RHPHLLRRSLLHNLRRLPGGRWTWKYDRALLDAPLQRLPASFEAVRSGIPGIRCPVLVVHGALSDVIAIDDAAELARALPDGRLVQVDGAGHTVQGDNPRGFVDALRAFLSDVYPLAPRKESK
ncbi:MAG TPA: alpha/beta hydrolase, partial [Candidatus Dormibacteraeota bacterium]|nr:alpha/beta hydrolase [Candidatus Dormibacteraeota bacterium]